MTFLAYLSAVLKCIIYGSTIFFTANLTQSIDVLDLLSLRFLLSFAVMWLLKISRIVKINVGLKDLLRPTERTPYLKNLILAGLFEPVLYMFLETAGVSMTTNITAAVLLSLSPISSCIVEEIILKERSTLLQKFFLACGIFGVLFITLQTDTVEGKNSVLGILALIFCVLSGSMFCAFSRKSSAHFSTMEITYFSCAMGAIAFNGINVVRHLFRGDILNYFDPYFMPENWLGFFFLGVVSTILAVALSNFALSRLQVSTLSAFGGLSTLVTIAIGVLFAHEKLESYHLIGMIFILLRMVGVSAIAIRRDRINRR